MDTHVVAMNGGIDLSVAASRRIEDRLADLLRGTDIEFDLGI